MRIQALGLLLVLLGVVAVMADQSFFEGIDTGLSRHQTTTGAFKSGDTVDAESTANGVFLAALFAPSSLNLEATKSYLISLQNGDGGFSSKNGLASDVESTKHAFLALKQLKAAPTNVANIATFLKSVRDDNNGLYLNKPGAKGSVEATAHAIQVLEQLGEAGKAQLKEGAKLAAFLKHAWTSEFFAFAEPALHPISSQYYATEIAEATGYDLAPYADKLCKFVVDQLAKLPRTSANTEVAFHGIAALKALSAAAKINCVDKVDEDALRESFDDVTNTLNSAAYLYQALALTDELADLFREKVVFQTADGAPVGSRLIFGTTVKPTFATEPTNPNFEVTLHSKLPNSASSGALTYDAVKRAYIGKEVSKTAEGGLGKATFTFDVKLALFALGGNAEFKHAENRLVGYGIAVDADATLEGGRQVEEGATVSPGTSFNFGVTLHSDTEASIVSGDFDVIFSVLDASHVEVHSEKSTRKGNNAPIKFAYVLKNANLPAGELVFRFEVATAATGVHTSDSVSYRLSAPMVAGQIQLAKQYKLGETVKVSMEPGVLSGLRNVVALAGKDGARTFLLDVKSPGGVLLHSVKGTCQGSRVAFELPLSATLDSIGTQLVSFRFVAANGDTVQLANYDSAAGELHDESNAVAFTVPVDLALQSQGEKPSPSAFVYGADIAYNFKVKDTISGLEIKTGKVEAANVYLSLRAADGGRGQVSVHIPAQASAKGLAIHWNINPNAVRGAGVVEIAAEDADGNPYPLHEEGKKESVQLSVNIGGDISVKPETIASTVFDRRGNPKTAFVVKFSLACKGKALTGAALKAVVELVSEAGLVTPVASALPVATAGSDYEVSWSSTGRSPSGTYRVRFYREADRVRGDSAGIFELSIPHESGAATKLPVRTEFLAVLAGLALYLAAHSRRSKYEKTK